MLVVGVVDGDNRYHYITTSNQTFRNVMSGTGAAKNGSSSLSVTCWMDAADTAHIALYIDGESGGKIVDVIGSGVGSTDTFFSGIMVA